MVGMVVGTVQVVFLEDYDKVECYSCIRVFVYYVTVWSNQDSNRMYGKL